MRITEGAVLAQTQSEILELTSESKIVFEVIRVSDGFVLSSFFSHPRHGFLHIAGDDDEAPPEQVIERARDEFAAESSRRQMKIANPDIITVRTDDAEFGRTMSGFTIYVTPLTNIDVMTEAVNG